MSYLVVTALGELISTVSGMSYSRDLTDEQWALLGPVFNAPGKCVVAVPPLVAHRHLGAGADGAARGSTRG